MITRSMLAQLLAANTEAGSRAATAGIQQQGEMDRQRALKGYLKPDGSYQAGSEAGTAGAEQANKNEANLKTLEDPRLQDQLNNGGSVKVGDLGVGADPTAHLIGKQQGGEDAAYKHAVDIYQKGIGAGTTSLQALHTLMGALQSNDSSSMGQLRTGMVLANGFKRYNDNEGKALTPDDKEADVSGLLGKFGIGLKDNTLNDVTRSNVVRFINNKLDELGDAHDTIKTQAQYAYSGSRYADPQKASNLGSRLGAPIDLQLQQMRQRLGQFRSQALPQSPAQGSNAPSQGLAGYLSGLGNAFMGKNQQQAPSAPQAGKVKVRRKSDGATGSMDASDPALQSGIYEQVQ